MGAERNPDTDPEQLADELDEQADELQDHSEHLEEKVIEVRREWDQKRSDPSVPGANPPERDEAEEETESQQPDAPPWSAGTDDSEN
jgi:hypothetical protein